MPTRPNLDEYPTVKPAAESLGVGPSTRRSRDRAGKPRPHRHRMNQYRPHRRAGLEAVLRSAGRLERDDG